jgi:hypothetical protein
MRSASGQGVPLSVLSDESGVVVLGWLARDVLYVRTEGALSARLGQHLAERLRQLCRAGLPFNYFSDASALTQYDLLARSAFVRVVLEHRTRFLSITMLTWSEGVSRNAKALADTLGGTVSVLTNESEFERRLLQHAPLAIEASNTCNP